MTDSRPAPSNRKRPAAEPAPSLRLQLADRERRLQELTEQSLQILDRLAQARDELRERDALRQQVAELQGLLADTRQRVRAASRAVLGPEASAQTGWQLVVWGVTEADAPRIEPLLAALPDVSVTLLLSAGASPASFVPTPRLALGVLDSTNTTPAQFWNQAMASSQADVVVLLRVGVEPAPGTLARLAAAAADDGVAVVSAACRHGDGPPVLGLEDCGLLELQPAVIADAHGALAVPFAQPEAFALARRAFAQLGPFDQDLCTELALAEWSLRASARRLRCLALADAEVALAAPTPPAPASVVDDDRLIVLARHRPEQLAAAALASPSLWQQPPAQIAAVLRAAFRRLPQASQFPGAVDLLVAQAQGVADSQRSLPRLHDSLRQVAALLELPLPAAGVAGVADGVVASLRARLQDLAALRGQLAELAAQARAVPELREDLARHAAAIREQKDEMLAKAGTIDSLKDEMIARERAIMSLRQEVLHRQAEIDRQGADLEHQGADLERMGADLERQRAEIERLQGHAQDSVALQQLRLDHARLDAECQALRAELARLQQQAERLLAQVGQTGDVTQQLSAARDRLLVDRDQLAADREQLAAHHDHVVADRDRLAAETERIAAEKERIAAEKERAVAEKDRVVAEKEQASSRLDQLERRLAEENQRLRSVVVELEQFRTGHESLRREHGSLQEQRIELQSRAHELVLILREREKWILGLLVEVQRPRWRGRKLLPHEREFLARHQKPPAP